MARELYGDNSGNNIMASSSAGGFGYSNVVSANQIQGFESNQAADQIFNLSTSMEMIDFSKHHHQHTNAAMWRTFFNKLPTTGPPSSSLKPINDQRTNSGFYNHHDHLIAPGIAGETSSDQNLLIGSNDQSSPNWQHQQVDDSSLRWVFPCEGNERPSQGLSLSLSSNPTSIGVQSFELRQTHHNPGAVKADHNHHHQELVGRYGNAQGAFQIRNSKFLAPAQEVLKEFCSLGTKHSDEAIAQKQKKAQKAKQQWDDESASTSSLKQLQLQSLEFMELQKRKAKLTAMLEELDRRYKHYGDQMRATVASFEALAGSKAAEAYTALASKAMSRHFRCLRDAVVSQIGATRKAMGEKDPVAPGTSRGETPRLRVLDQAFRQQKAYQQMSMLDSHPWRPQRGLPERAVSILRAWLFEHFLHPYPSDVDKHILARQTGLSRSQVSNWFINARVRLWKPMIEEMYLEETKVEGLAQDQNNNNNAASTSDPTTADSTEDGRPVEHKPDTSTYLVRIDPESLSSIITHKSSPNPTNPKASLPTSFHGAPPFASSSLLDFSSYGHHQAATFRPHATTQGFNHGGGVSLTLGLQQHAGVSLGFSQPNQSSLFYGRNHQIDECDDQHGGMGHYSLLEGEGQSLPYRNLMGAQLLHDLV